MSTPIAIVVAAVILAAALLVACRWEIGVPRQGFPFVLDRWTGQVVVCARRPEIPADSKKGGFANLLKDEYAPPHKPGTGYLLDCRP